MARSNTYKIQWRIAYFFMFVIIAATLYMVFKGAVNYNRIAVCKDVAESEFCGIKEIKLQLPDALKRKIFEEVDKGSGKRVVIPGWKAGRTISTGQIQKDIPELFDWYKGLEGKIGSEIGENVFVTENALPTTCAVLVYEEDGDFINWHYDVNYFNGRFFTLLIPCTFDDDICTEYTYYDKDGALQGLKTKPEKSILFEGDKVFHMATKFCKKAEKKRVVVSVQFSTDPTISWYNRAIMRVKDTAYIGY